MSTCLERYPRDKSPHLPLLCWNRPPACELPTYHLSPSQINVSSRSASTTEIHVCPASPIALVEILLPAANEPVPNPSPPPSDHDQSPCPSPRSPRGQPLQKKQKTMESQYRVLAPPAFLVEARREIYTLSELVEMGCALGLPYQRMQKVIDMMYMTNKTYL